jgi:hypothetical protein
MASLDNLVGIRVPYFQSMVGLSEITTTSDRKIMDRKIAQMSLRGELCSV